MGPRTIEAIRAGRGLPSHAAEALEAAYRLQEALKFVSAPNAPYSLDKAKYLNNVLQACIDEAITALEEHGGIPAPPRPRPGSEEERVE